MRPILHRAALETPVGSMIALTAAAGLCALEFDLPGRQALLAARLQKWFTGYQMEAMREERKGPLVDWLTRYFKRDFPAAPLLDLRGSAFEKRVWEALLAIQPSETITYARLAQSLGIAGSARAVGSAVRRNPISLIVPCHRVVGSDGTLRGYGGGLPQKRWLLDHEAL